MSDSETGRVRPSPRIQFRENRQRRQNAVFSIIVSVLTALALISVLVLSGIVPVPFFDKFSASEDVVEAGQSPCFPENAKPAKLEGIHVTVLNATGRPGLAAHIAGALEDHGVVVDTTGNYEGQFYGTVTLTAGKSQVINAYTLARVFEDSKVSYDPSDPKAITIVVGERFVDLPSTDDIDHLLSPEVPLKQNPSCKPLPREKGK